jgi:hypothetical protein
MHFGTDSSPLVAPQKGSTTSVTATVAAATVAVWMEVLVAGRCQRAIGEHNAINAASFLQLPQLGSQGPEWAARMYSTGDSGLPCVAPDSTSNQGDMTPSL